MTDTLQTVSTSMLSDVEIWRSVGALILVLALMLAGLWLLRRIQRGAARSRTGIGVDLEVLGRLALSPKQSVTVVRVGGQNLILGVTEQTVQLIGEYSGAIQPTGNTESSGNAFAGILEKTMQRFHKAVTRNTEHVPEATG